MSTRFNQIGNAKPLWFLAQPPVRMDWHGFKTTILGKLSAIEAAAMKDSGNRIISNKADGQQWTSIFGSKVPANEPAQQAVLNNEN